MKGITDGIIYDLSFAAEHARQGKMRLCLKNVTCARKALIDVHAAGSISLRIKFQIVNLINQFLLGLESDFSATNKPPWSLLEEAAFLARDL